METEITRSNITSFMFAVWRLTVTNTGSDHPVTLTSEWCQYWLEWKVMKVKRGRGKKLGKPISFHPIAFFLFFFFQSIYSFFDKKYWDYEIMFLFIGRWNDVLSHQWSWWWWILSLFSLLMDISDISCQRECHRIISPFEMIFTPLIYVEEFREDKCISEMYLFWEYHLTIIQFIVK